LYLLLNSKFRIQNSKFPLPHRYLHHLSASLSFEDEVVNSGCFGHGEAGAEGGGVAGEDSTPLSVEEVELSYN
jgi:hypothetical protein